MKRHLARTCLLVLIAASPLAACGDDDNGKPTPTADGGGDGAADLCGNGAIDDGEMCDGSDLDGMTCADATMNPDSTGDLACSDDCTFDTSGCMAGGGEGGMGGMGGSGGMGPGGAGGMIPMEGGAGEGGPTEGGTAGDASMGTDAGNGGGDASPTDDASTGSDASTSTDAATD